jgi:adenylosuccinate lyase
VTEFIEGKVGSSAMPHKLNPVASGSVVLLGRLLRARATTILDYVHSEWEDDHRQGETAWAFPQEVCLLLGAQLVIGRRLLATLVVKPENMRRNLERGGGSCPEAVMMALPGRSAATARTRSCSPSPRNLRAGVGPRAALSTAWVGGISLPLSRPPSTTRTLA